jgi:hypothetical protein
MNLSIAYALVQLFLISICVANNVKSKTKLTFPASSYINDQFFKLGQEHFKNVMKSNRLKDPQGYSLAVKNLIDRVVGTANFSENFLIVIDADPSRTDSFSVRYLFFFEFNLILNSL